METNTLLILRRFSILVTLLFFSVMLNAQIKIKSRVEIAPKAATSNSIEGDSVYLTSFTLEYPAEVRPSSTLFETSYIDTITGKLVNGPCCPVSCNGHYVVGVNAECGQGTYGIFAAGTVLTFSTFPPGNSPEQCYIGKSEIFSYPDNCGGCLRIFQRYESGDKVIYFDPSGSSSCGFIVGIGRIDFCPPLSITFDITWDVSLMYTKRLYIPINVKDACSYWNSPTPILYRVEITTGKEWSSLYDEVSGKRGTVIDSLYSPDGWSGFYVETTDQEPSEPQQGILTVSSYGDVVPPITLNYTITPYKRTLLVTPGKNNITYGDTTSLTLTTIDASGNPTGEELLDARYSIIKGNEYSTLQSSDSTVIGDTIEGVFPSAILRTADDGNAPDSLDILIETVATVPCPECILGKIASKNSSKDKGVSFADIRNELLSQRRERIPPTVLTKQQPAMQTKSNENQPHTTGSQKALDKIMPLSKTTSSSSPHLNMIQYDGVTKNLYGLTKVTVKKEGPELVVEYPTDNLMERHDIDQTPYMPDIIPRAYLKNYDGGTVNFQWNLRVQWVGPDGRKFDNSFPGNTQASNSDISSWVINWKEITRGGDEITLDVTATAGGKVYDKTVNHGFKILGLNPSPAQVKEGLTLAQKVLVYQESVPKWCQFGKQKEGYPSWGSPHGYGLMQVDPPSDNEQVWNWRANLTEGKARFDAKFILAGKYYLDIQNGTTKPDHPYPNDVNGDYDYYYYYDKKTSKPIKFNAQPMSADQQLSEAFQRYNGGTYWKWIPDDKTHPERSGQWKAYPPVPHKDHDLSYGDECWQLYCNPPSDLN